MQHMKAAAGTEANTAERHTELAYEGGGRREAQSSSAEKHTFCT